MYSYKDVKTVMSISKTILLDSLHSRLGLHNRIRENVLVFLPKS